MNTLSKVALLLAGALTGCSGMSSRQPASAPAAAAPAADTPRAAPQQADGLPAVNLNADLLYRILLAEIAGQRGNTDVSAESYLRVATQTRDPRLARRATQLGLVTHNMDVAMRASRLWVEVAPHDTDAHQAVAALLIRKGQTEQALVHLRQILKLVPPGRDHGYLIVARLLGTEQDKPKALAVMQRLVDESGRNADAIYAYAYLAAQSGATDRALALVNQLLAVTPDDSQALILRSAIYTQMGRKDDALEGYARAVNGSPQDSNLRLAYARELLSMNRLPEAREQFRRLARELPTNGDVLYAHALLAAESDDLQEAEEGFEELLKSGQRSNEAAYNLGQLAEKRKEPAKAMEWYRAMSPGGADYLDGQFRYAQLLAKGSGHDAALEYLRGVEYTDEERPKRVLFEGELLRQAERYKEAMALYDQALSTDFPRNHELRYARAMVAEKVGRIDLLEKDLKTILAEDPEHTHALNSLGYTLAEHTDRLDEAQEYLSRALAKEPEDSAILDSMGWLRYRQGRYSEALEYLRKAIEHNPDSEIAGHLGATLWRLGQQDEARRVWDAALRNEPQPKALQAIIDKVTGK